ncbi:MAG: glycosyltransferase [Anaerolineales bacterium]|nr:glycosyltransferase [Anaerolineales bacterium]
MILVIFTASYPFDFIEEQNFLGGEMEFLLKEFERIVYVPRNARGNLLPLPERVEVDTSLSDLLSIYQRVVRGFRVLLSMAFYQDFKDRFPRSLSFRYFRRLYLYLSGAYLTRDWTLRWLQREKVSEKEVLFYAFWFDEIPAGVGMAKENCPDIRIVSRAHGYDIYEERSMPWPCRREAIAFMDSLLADSEKGDRYFHDRYPEFKGKYGVSLMGVPDPGALSRPSEDGVLRIVSCSTTASVKRIELLIEGIALAAGIRTTLNIEWVHFGDGPNRRIYIDKMTNAFAANVRGCFPGYTTRDDLIRFYLENPVDIFVNVSSSEGTSVAIMEAISCGIPVIATSVGGNVEIVNDKNGFLLPPDPTPNDIAEVLFKVFDHPNEMRQKRIGSRQIWSEKYNETVNSKEFAKLLSDLRSYIPQQSYKS